jgi:hypothetical protein
LEVYVVVFQLLTLLRWARRAGRTRTRQKLHPSA